MSKSRPLREGRIEQTRPRCSRTRGALAFGAYLVFLAMCAEITARCLVSYTPYFIRNFAVGNDAQWRLAWIKRHEQTGVNVYYQFDAHDPRRGWAIKPNLKNEPAFLGKTLNTNSRGVRGAFEHSYAKTPRTPRIVVIGDSFTFGDELNDDETYAAQLQAHFPKAEVINLGVHGYGHDQMLIYLQEEGIKYRPDVVLLGFVAGDAYRNVLAFRDYAKPRFVLEPDATLRLTNVPVPRPEEVLRLEWQRIKAIDVAFALAGRVAGPPPIEHVQQLTGALLREIGRSTRAAGATPVWLYLPSSSTTGQAHSNEIHALDASWEWETWFLGQCEVERVSCLSLRPAFLAARARGVWLKDFGHWSPEQNRVAAEAIASFLAGQSLLKAASR